MKQGSQPVFGGSAPPRSLPPETSQDGLRNSLEDIRIGERLKPTEVVRAHGGRESRSGSNPQRPCMAETVTGRRDAHFLGQRNEARR